MRRVLAIIGGVFVLLIVVLAGRAVTMRSRQIAVDPVELVAVDEAAVVERFSGSLRFKTVSVEEAEEWDAGPFLAFHLYIEEQFPLVHARLKKEVVNDYTLLYTWEGRDPGRPPVLLLSHMDVVPVVPGTEGLWEQPPYEGRVVDGYVWGRGALDDKLGVLGILEAVEYLLGQGFQPTATTYLSFGHDEELGGDRGAQAIAALLDSRGVKLDYVLDEGGAIINDVVPGIDDYVAAVGIAEKGSVTVELTARSLGGHSSSPPEHTTIGELAAAIYKLERNQMPMKLRGAAHSFFEYAGPEMSLPYRVIFGNLWLFGGVVESRLASGPATSATVRTTTAATVISGGVKSNVLPTDARALVNFRILPGDTVEDVVEHVKEVVGPSIEVRPLPDSREASGVSPVDTAAFERLQKTIRQVFPGTVVAPYLTLGGTDSRYFYRLTPNIYKFAPIIGDRSDLTRMHGTNERMSIENYVKVVQFFIQLLQNNNEPL